MRITQSIVTRNYMKGYNSAYENMMKAQERYTSGRAFTKGWEDVSGAARAMNIRIQLSDTEQRLANLDEPEARINAAYSNLTSINDILEDAQAKLKKAMSGTNAEQRPIIAEELDNMKKEVLDFMNSKFGSKYLFNGTDNSSAPFKLDKDTGDILYNGIKVQDIFQDPDDGELYYMADDPDNPGAQLKKMVPHNKDTYIDIGLGMMINGDNVDERTAFKTSFSGINMLGFGVDAETGLPNNLFTVLDQIVEGLNAEDYDEEAMEKLSDQLVKSTDHLMMGVSELSSRMQFLNTTSEHLKDDILNLTTLHDKIECSDEKEEIMNIKTFQANFNAILQFGSYILPLSLFDFMG